LQKERQLLHSYLENDGKLFFMADINTPQSYVDWLSGYGVNIGDNVIIDEVSASVGAEPVTPIGATYSPEHPVTRAFRSMTAFTLARPLETGEVTVSGLDGTVTVLSQTGATAYLIPLKEILSGQAVTFSSEGKQPGTYALAVAGKYHQTGVSPSPSPSPDGEQAAEPPSSRLVVSSSTDTFSNQYLNLAGNRDFGLNAINWLAESENQITVRVKDPKVQPISLPTQSQNWLYFIFCILIPVLSALTGILIAYYRRQGKKL
jgi:ABC-type uncharacterized transport system involved in gliding motility auxiliary subunit